MRTIAIGSIIAFALVGCGSKDSGTGTTDPATGTTTETGTTQGGTTTTEVLELSIVWTDVDGGVPSDSDGTGGNDTNCTSDTVDIVITDPLLVNSWDFGMAEVGTAGWTAEDCLNGYAGFNFCHPISATHQLTEQCGFSITEGSTTFLDYSKDPFLTYYIDDQGDCFVTGNDPSYYDSLGCEVLM